MTHEYTLLVGGTVRRGDDAPGATALAYALGTVLAVGSDGEVRAISRGDSRVIELAGLAVVPGPGDVIEPGAPASFSLVDPSGVVVAIVRAGEVVEGAFPAPA